MITRRGSILVGGRGSRGELVAGFVQYRRGQFLQVLGQVPSTTSRAADQIFDSIRSIAAIRDTSMLHVTSDRLHFATVKSEGDFAALLGAMVPQAMSVEDTAILNNLRATAVVPAGTTIKIVRKGRRP